MSSPHEDLADHIQPALDEARLHRQFAAITARRRPAAAIRWPMAVAFPVVIAAVLALFVWGHRRADPAPVGVTGTTVEAPAGGETITLPDGSTVVLAPGSLLSMDVVQADAVRLSLLRGGIELEVTHVEKRAFIVRARGYEVSVLGTHFTVNVDEHPPEPVLAVTVARGRVRIARDGDPSNVRVLGAGEAWSSKLGSTASASPSPRAVGTLELDDVVDTTPALTRTGDASTGSSPSAAINEPPPKTTPQRIEEGPKELLAKAEAARASGRPKDAASALNTLRSRYRGDPRAGLAAFELGRLRLDTLGDPGGAAEAFGDAMALAPNAPFREDAEARRIDALDAAGSTGRCNDAKASYLARYPTGIHRRAVSMRCGP